MASSKARTGTSRLNGRQHFATGYRAIQNVFYSLSAVWVTNVIVRIDSAAVFAQVFNGTLPSKTKFSFLNCLPPRHLTAFCGLAKAG